MDSVSPLPLPALLRVPLELEHSDSFALYSHHWPDSGGASAGCACCFSVMGITQRPALRVSQDLHTYTHPHYGVGGLGPTLVPKWWQILLSPRLIKVERDDTGSLWDTRGASTQSSL